FPQPPHIAPQRAQRHSEPLRQLVPQPVPVALQQGKQLQGPGAGIGHALSVARIRGDWRQELSSILPTVVVPPNERNEAMSTTTHHQSDNQNSNRAATS